MWRKPKVELSPDAWTKANSGVLEISLKQMAITISSLLNFAHFSNSVFLECSALLFYVLFLRVDHLYTFFVQWSPDVYGKDAKDQGFVVVEKEELDMIDNFFSEPSTKSWEVSLFSF